MAKEKVNQFTTHVFYDQETDRFTFRVEFAVGNPVEFDEDSELYPFYSDFLNALEGTE